MRIACAWGIHSCYRRAPRYRRGVADRVKITIRNTDGKPVGRVACDPDGTVVAEVIDEEGRWLVELAAERHGAPRHPRPRPSCSPPNDGRTDMASGQPST